MKNQIATLHIQFENYLKKGHYIKENNALYEPIEFMLHLKAKRLRPLLCLMAFQLKKDSIESALPAATAIELFHNFTLMHDDIMDDADLRRSEPTVYKKYGINAAILSGDLMLIQSYQYLQRLSTKYQFACLEIFNDTAVEVCEGQQLDMDFEQRLDVSTEAYIDMIRKKTAALIAGSLQLGGTIAELDQTDIDYLYQFGINLGLTFQLLDDVLDVFGTTEKFGKKRAGDIVQNKKTYLLIKALELANPTDKASLLNWIEKETFNEEDKINHFIEIYKKNNIEQLARDKAASYHQKAFKCLDLVNIHQDKKKPLKDYATYLLNRMV